MKSLQAGDAWCAGQPNSYGTGKLYDFKVTNRTPKHLTLRSKTLKAYKWSILLHGCDDKWSILLHGCECWTLTKEFVKRLVAAEMYIRRIKRTSRTEKKSYEEVIEMYGYKRPLTLKTMGKRNLPFLGGHIYRVINRAEGLDLKKILLGKTCGTKGRGRQCTKYS